MERMIRCITIALLIGAMGCSQTSKNKREIKTKCLSCLKNITDCAPKYRIPKNHTACLPYHPDAEPLPLTADEKIQIVQQHNDIRANVSPPADDMLKMFWDEELEMIAIHWAYQCKFNDKNAIQHDSVRFIPGRTSVGQNIARGFKGFKEAIVAWAWENFWYKFSFGKPINTVEAIGHYTQLVWATSNRIGCGRSHCKKRGKLYVCNYAPGGNTVPFKSPYKKAETQRGSMCKTKTSDGLCDCGSLFCGHKYLFVNNCTCSCQPGPECDLDCTKTKDTHPYCNSVPGYYEKDCETKWYMPGNCPILCGYCPCSGKGYKPQECDYDVPHSSTTESAEIHTLYAGVLLVISWIDSLL